MNLQELMDAASSAAEKVNVLQQSGCSTQQEIEEAEEEADVAHGAVTDALYATE